MTIPHYYLQILSIFDQIVTICKHFFGFNQFYLLRKLTGSTKRVIDMKGLKMNVKQKIGLGIMTPLFALAVGHTLVNKNKTDEAKQIEFFTGISDALNEKSKSDTAYFRAAQQIQTVNDIKKDIHKGAVSIKDLNK